MHKLPLDKKKLGNLLKQCRHFDVSPMDLPIFCHGAGIHPLTQLLADLIEECVLYLSAMTEQEIVALLDSLPPGVTMFVDQPPIFRESASLQRVAVYYLVAELQREYLSLKQVVRSDLNESEILKLYPELRNRMDDDGLLYVDEHFKLLDGGVEYRDHILQYHQFLRRGYTSSPNFDFTWRFIDCYHRTCTHNQFRIAVDHRRVMAKEFYQKIVEFDRWFGAHFDPERLDDPYSTGLTVVKRNKDSLFELTNSLDRTEFFWSFRRGIKTLQIEEISDKGYQFDHYYLNRYVHSERNVQERMLVHLDGAVKVYLPDKYEDRLDSYMPNQPRSYAKIKLFRVDGDIELDDWIYLISLFYKSNEMIFEYFNPEEFEAVFEERVRDFKAWKQKQ